VCVCIHCSKGICCGISHMNIFYSNQINPLYYSLCLSSPASFSTAFSVLLYYFHTQIQCILTLVTLCPFQFPSLPTIIKQNHYYKHFSLNIWIYDHGSIYVYVYLLGVASSYEREHETFIFLKLITLLHKMILYLLVSIFKRYKH
jgi:hypothetical protein